MPHVETAEFELLEEPIDDMWVVRVEALGSGFVSRAVPFRAAVGTVPIELITLLDEGEGFIGLLAAEPAVGDHLRVGYGDGELEDTDVEYQIDTT
jgi:hypothetical protein